MEFSIKELIHYFKYTKDINKIHHKYYIYFLQINYRPKNFLTIEELDDILDRETLEYFIDWHNKDMYNRINECLDEIQKEEDRQKKLLEQADRNIEMFKEIGCFKQAKSWEYLKKTIR
ncbi:MAG: hypothetical protein ACRC0A_07785 [Chitinophagaceae bacterium]